MKNKRILWIALIALDVIITVALFVIHIIMLASIVNKTPDEIEALTGLPGYLAQNTWVYFGAFVIPTFVILAANIIGLVLYVRNQTKKEAADVKFNDLTDEQKEALKKELLNELNDK